MVTIVVTGVSSFIGCHLANYFASHGDQVIGTITKPRTEYQALSVKRLEYCEQKGTMLKQLNLLDEKACLALIQSKKPDYWIHHAAWAKNYNQLDYDFKQGIDVGVHSLTYLYPALKQCGTRGVIITGSNAEYSIKEGGVDEFAQTRPAMPYGVAKLTCSLYAEVLADRYQLPTRVPRLFNLFGKYDNPNKLIPNIIQSLRDQKPIELTACEHARDFIYIDDVVIGYAALIKDLHKGDKLFEIYNLSSGEAVKLKEFLCLFAKKMQIDDDVFNFGVKAMRNREPMINYGINLKAKKYLDWHPRSLNKGIEAFLSINTIREAICD